ncbi:MAG: signal peptidase II [Gemmatimonadaceae bacterium]|nr:signal peptidase II [Gemmatimonadaceae bacterium]
MRTAYKTWPFWAIVAVVTVFDYITKVMAVNNLQPRHIPHEVFGNVVRFTLAYNPGAAFGMHLGPASRWIFAALSVVIVVVLLRTTAELTRFSRFAAVGVPIVIGGAIGNLLDRIRQREGVVDFIDIGFGDVRFWTFNVADSAVTVGAICLIIALWHEERAHAAAEGHPAGHPGDADGKQATRQSTS